MAFEVELDGRLMSDPPPRFQATRNRNNPSANEAAAMSRRKQQSDAVQSPLETYLREINQTALLTAQQEKELAYRIEDGDSLARDQMVRANLRLVVNIARGYSGQGLALQDLIE